MKVGALGRSTSFNFVSFDSYSAASVSTCTLELNQFQGRKNRLNTGAFRILMEVNARNGLATRSSQSPTGPCHGQLSEAARCALRMLPPETDEMVRSLARMPNSLSLRTAPKWKSAARYPPPESDNPMPARCAAGAKFCTALAGAGGVRIGAGALG